MHRFLIEATTLSSDRSVWLQPEDSLAWRCLVTSFRQNIKARNWRLIDLSIKMMVTIDNDGGQAVLVEDLATRSDYYVASAYLRAALLEHSTMMVYASDRLPWSQLKEFRAARSQRQQRQKGGALGHNGQTVASGSLPATLAIEERLPEPRSLDNRNRRNGKPDILAGDSLVQPKMHQGDCRGKDSTRQCLKPTGRSTARSRSPGPDDQGTGLVDKSTAELSNSI